MRADFQTHDSCVFRFFNGDRMVLWVGRSFSLTGLIDMCACWFKKLCFWCVCWIWKSTFFNYKNTSIVRNLRDLCDFIYLQEHLVYIEITILTHSSIILSQESLIIQNCWPSLWALHGSAYVNSLIYDRRPVRYSSQQIYGHQQK